MWWDVSQKASSQKRIEWRGKNIFRVELGKLSGFKKCYDVRDEGKDVDTWRCVLTVAKVPKEVRAPNRVVIATLFAVTDRDSLLRGFTLGHTSVCEIQTEDPDEIVLAIDVTKVRSGDDPEIGVHVSVFPSHHEAPG